MIPYKVYATTVLTLAIAAAACNGAPAASPTPGPGGTSGSLLSSPTPLADTGGSALRTTESVLVNAPTSTTSDLTSYLLTEAYSLVTPQWAFTPAPPATNTQLAPTVASGLRPSATAPASAAPSSVIISEPIMLPNAVNTATCRVSNLGDCAPTMTAGADLHFDWVFGVKGSQNFNWGSAAVSVIRDGQPFLWKLAGNGLVQPPGKDQTWILRVGESADFRAGLEHVAPGYYVARLMICPLAPAECAAGRGWQNVGGEAINFLITP